MLERYLDEPDLPDVDLFLRSSGEQRMSNFLLWQSAYAELVFMDGCGRTSTAGAVGRRREYARRDRRYGRPSTRPPAEGRRHRSVLVAGTEDLQRVAPRR